MADGAETSTSETSRNKKRRSRKKESKSWLNGTVAQALRKMKLVGLKQALKPGVYWAERLFWMAVFLLCVGVTVYLTVDTVLEYSANPILHTFHEDEPIYKIPFPSTTITGTTVLKKDAIGDSIDLYEAKRLARSESFEFKGQPWTKHIVNSLLFTIDHFCELVNSFATRKNILHENIVQKFNIKKSLMSFAEDAVELHDNKDDANLRDHVIPFLKDKTMNCNNILLACLWEGEDRNCNEIFVPVQTDVGTGCSFNRIPEKNLRKNQGLLSLLHDHTYSKEELNYWKNFKADSLDSISAEGVSNFLGMLYPMAQHHAGKLRGLSFMIAFDEDVDGLSCPIVDSYGYLLGIHSPFEEPQMMKTGVAIPPRHEIFVKVKAELTVADKNIKSLQVGRRKCYFQKENLLKNFKVYTTANCHQECLGTWIYKSCNCTLLTLSAGQNEVLCGPSQVKCVQNITAELENGGYKTLCDDPICYPPCTEVKYDSDVSYLPYYKDALFDLSNLNLDESLPQRNTSVTSITHVTFGSDSVTTRERKLQFSFYVLFGVIGGAWGMTLEFSIFTFFNILSGLAVLIFSKYACRDEDDEDMENPNGDGDTPAEGVSGAGSDAGNGEEGEGNQRNPESTPDSTPESRIPEELGQEHQDSCEESTSALASEASESSSSELTTEIEVASTPPQNNDDGMNQLSDIQTPNTEASVSTTENPNDPVIGLSLAAAETEDKTPTVLFTSEAIEENPKDSISGVASASSEAENENPKNTSASEFTEENPEVQNEDASRAMGDTPEVTHHSASSLQGPIDWDKELDELLELCKL